LQEVYLGIGSGVFLAVVASDVRGVEVLPTGVTHFVEEPSGGARGLGHAHMIALAHGRPRRFSEPP
jgi:hypothetical protein